ncbi:MAG: hypothetical protein LBH86_03080 [Oscillospiraceae bacterium]|jgi:hypothetical protein|nr:hypothetical protein [Oscillospiraceae bacterium]
MTFDFEGFVSADYCDTPENANKGLKIVDFIADDGEKILFIEVKNYARKSDDATTKEHLTARQETDYRMLTDPDAAFPLEMGMKFKDSLLRWYASGHRFDKPVAMLLVINPPDSLREKDIIRLIQRIDGYIPTGLNAEQYPKFTSTFFALVTADEAEHYGFSVTVNP